MFFSPNQYVGGNPEKSQRCLPGQVRRSPVFGIVLHSFINLYPTSAWRTRDQVHLEPVFPAVAAMALAPTGWSRKQGFGAQFSGEGRRCPNTFLIYVLGVSSEEEATDVSLGRPVTHRGCLYPWRVGCGYVWTTIGAFCFSPGVCVSPREPLPAVSCFLGRSSCLWERKAPLLVGELAGLLDVMDPDSISATGVREAAHPVSLFKGLLLPKPLLW